MATENLQSIWRERPLFRLGIIILPILAAAALAIVIWGLQDEEVPDSAVQSAPEVTQVPLSEDDPPAAFVEALRSESARGAQAASQTGESFIPTPIGDVVQSDLGGDDDRNEPDPLAPWRQVAEPALEPEPPPLPPPPQEPVPPPPLAPPPPQEIPPDITPLTEAMLGYMQALRESWSAAPAQVVTFSFDEEEAAGTGDGGGTGTTAESDTTTQGAIIVPAGSIVFGQTLTEADSDVPGPVLVSVLSGRFEGGRLIGGFEAAEEHLILRFDTLVHQNQEYAVDIVALDPETTLTAVATDVNRRYLRRIVLPAAAEFLAEFADAVSQVETTVVVSDDLVVEENTDLDFEEEVAAGLSGGIETVADLLDEEGSSIPIQVRVRRGTPIGLLFVTSLREGSIQ